VGQVDLPEPRADYDAIGCESTLIDPAAAASLLAAPDVVREGAQNRLKSITTLSGTCSP
jgi:hypothetical protein